MREEEFIFKVDKLLLRKNKNHKQTTGINKMQFLDQLKESLVSAFMNVPQVDTRNARVPVEINTKQLRERLQQQEGFYWAYTPQFPMAK
jgi:hypothetical protein